MKVYNICRPMIKFERKKTDRLSIDPKYRYQHYSDKGQNYVKVLHF